MIKNIEDVKGELVDILFEYVNTCDSSPAKFRNFLRNRGDWEQFLTINGLISDVQSLIDLLSRSSIPPKIKKYKASMSPSESELFIFIEDNNLAEEFFKESRLNAVPIDYNNKDSELQHDPTKLANQKEFDDNHNQEIGDDIECKEFTKEPSYAKADNDQRTKDNLVLQASSEDNLIINETQNELISESPVGSASEDINTTVTSKEKFLAEKINLLMSESTSIGPVELDVDDLLFVRSHWTSESHFYLEISKALLGFNHDLTSNKKRHE